MLTNWTWAAPVMAWLLLALGQWVMAPPLIVGLLLAGVVIAAVHHAEIIAHRVGEPYGTLALALSVTVIEVGLIISLMAGAPEEAATLARDTVIAAVMIILNGIIGICLLIGGLRHGEQTFEQRGVSASLATLSALVVLSLVLPNFTVSEPGPVYAPSQLAFVGVVSLLLYGIFVTVQTVRHRDYFLPPGELAGDEEAHVAPPDNRATLFAALSLVASLIAVVLLAKQLATPVEEALVAIGAPRAMVGVIIAAVVLAPESVAAIRAALANRIQTSLNLALGSALATIGLTIPAVAALSLTSGLSISLGLDGKATVLLLLSLLVAAISLSAGRTTIMQGAVHLVIFGVYLFTTIVP